MPEKKFNMDEKKQRAFSLVKVAYYDCLIDEKSWKFKA